MCKLIGNKTTPSLCLYVQTRDGPDLLAHAAHCGRDGAEADARDARHPQTADTQPPTLTLLLGMVPGGKMNAN